MILQAEEHNISSGTGAANVASALLAEVQLQAFEAKPLLGPTRLLACYVDSSLEGPLALKSAARGLIVEDSLPGPLDCSQGTMDSFVNVFLFLRAHNAKGSFWLFALTKCLHLFM